VGSKSNSKVLVDVAPGFKSHVVEISKGFDIVQGLATFATNNPDDKANDPEPKALAKNQRPDINAGISNLENPIPDNLPEDEQKVGDWRSSVSLEPENSSCIKGLRSRGRPVGSKSKSKIPADVAPGFKSHVVDIRKGSDIVQGLATFVANNQDHKADDPEPKALANNQGPDVNTNISNSENPKPDNLPEDEQKVSGGKTSVSLKPENYGCTKRLRSRGRPARSKNKSKVPADVAPGFKSHVVEIRKGSDIVQGLATFAADNPDKKADDREPKALVNNKGPHINTNISNSENPNPKTYSKTSRKSAVGKAVFHSSLKRSAVQRG